MNSPNTTQSAQKLLFYALFVSVFLMGLLLPTFGQATPGQTFVEFKLNGLGTLLIPDTMELQSGAYKKLADGFKNDQGYDVSGDVVFQQKGLNEFNFKENKTYARVMIGTEISTQGAFQKLSAKVKATRKELELFSSIFQKEIVESFGNTGLRLLRWDGTSVVTVNGQSALKFSYLRQLNENPSVYVEIYNFQNNDRMHRLTISYRLQDATLWKDALERTKSSFKITNIR